MQQKGFANLILLVLIISGIALGLYLVGRPTAFKPQASENTPVTSVSSTAPTLAFVFVGESNSGGFGSNESATPEERAPTPAVQILNNYIVFNNLTHSFQNPFQDLDIGYNNTTDHSGIGEGVVHGFELQLANSVKAHAFPNNPQVYLIKTGQGGSTIDDWIPGGTQWYWDKFVQRISAAKSIIHQPNKPVQWIVWYTLGVNDHLGGLPAGTYKSNTVTFINRIKEQLPGAIIIMTQFQAMGDWTDYNAVQREIADSEPNVYIVDSTGAQLNTGDPRHWSYSGFKTVASRMVEITNSALTTVNGLSASPNPCSPNQAQRCTVRLSWNFPSISNLEITVRENPGSSLSSQIASGSVDIDWISASGATFDAYSGDTLLRSLFVKRVDSSPVNSPTPTPSTTPVTSSVAITANPNPCNLDITGHCTSKISWTSNDDGLKITIKENPGSLFGSGRSGSQDATWISKDGATFEAYSEGRLINSLIVKGQETGGSTNPSPTPVSISASPNPCNITSGTTCTSTIIWNFPTGSDVKITIKENPGSVFATGPSGSQTAPWIGASGATFQVYSNNNFVEELFVKGVSSGTSANPGVSSTASPFKNGDIDKDGDIDIFDYNKFLQDFVVKNLRSDIDLDGDVDVFDFNFLMRNFGK